MLYRLGVKRDKPERNCYMRGPVERRTMTIPEAAAVLGIGRNTAYELARRNELPGVIRLGGAIRVTRAAIEQMLHEADRRPHIS